MRIYSALISHSDENNDIFKIDAISYKGKLWLVPEWLSHSDQGYQVPARMICMSHLEHQKSSEAEGFADYIINNPIPISVLLGSDLTPEESKDYIVIENPDIPPILAEKRKAA